MIDILLATYNGEEFIAELLDSIIRQTVSDWQLLVSDDCSSDATMEIVKKYAKADSRIRIVSEGLKFGSATKNFLNLLNHSHSDYCMFCDQDDIWLDCKLEKTINRMHGIESSSGLELPIVVFTDMVVVDKSLDVISKSFFNYSFINPNRTMFANIIVENVAAGCTMMLNSKARSLGANYNDGIIMHDWWIMLVVSAFGVISLINEPTVLYRQTGKNAVGARYWSPVIPIGDAGSRVASELKCAKQARVFNQLYCSKLTEANRNRLKEYLSSFEGRTFPSSLARLIRSGCWKARLRKRLGQIRVLFLLSKTSIRDNGFSMLGRD